MMSNDDMVAAPLVASLPPPPSSITPTCCPSPLSSPSFSPLSSPHAFPVDWLCSSCSATHSVLTLLAASSSSAAGNGSWCCERPTLQAVYDQHGRIFLYWRNDPAIADLRDPAHVREAAGRVAEAAGCGAGADGAGWLRDVLLVLGREGMAGKARERAFS